MQGLPEQPQWLSKWQLAFQDSPARLSLKPPSCEPQQLCSASGSCGCRAAAGLAYCAPLEGRRQLLRLDFNENTIGPSPLVAQALRNFST
jgi:hypothetical protein